jgi:hypothetical protein
MQLPFSHGILWASALVSEREIAIEGVANA